MSIWKNKELTVEDLNNWNTKTMAQHLEMRYVEIGEDFLKMSMPVNDKTHQPYGLLHGGASAALAETIGSVSSALCIDTDRQICVGIEINCNHIRGVKDGLVYAISKPLHIGASTHVWDIRITDERDKLICVSRLTVAILPKSKL